MKRTGEYAILCALICMALSSCSTQNAEAQTKYQKNTKLSQDEVTLKVLGSSSSYRALETVFSSFHELYPNCTLEYEYVQDYDKSLEKRLSSNEDVDLFITKNITADSSILPYALELGGQKDALDLSDTYEGLIRNFTISGDNGGLYAIPLGGEVRGMYVNTTLLASLGLEIPKNYTELLACCKTLKEKGYIPLQGNPNNFGPMLMYPYVANTIANASDYEATYQMVNTHEAGSSKLFQEPVSRLYELVAKGYYDYKTVETTLNFFTTATDTAAAYSFLNIAVDSTNTPKKLDDIGQVAFMPQTMSYMNILDKTKEDLHSNISYSFILSPVSEDGGYAYLSPASGIAINKGSSHTDWSLEFLNYLFTKDIAHSFAQQQSLIPNSEDALTIIDNTFAIEQDHISQLGQVSFDYVFYDVIKKVLVDVSKGNNPKYMQADGTMYPLTYYMQELETALTKKE